MKETRHIRFELGTHFGVIDKHPMTTRVLGPIKVMLGEGVIKISYNLMEGEKI